MVTRKHPRKQPEDPGKMRFRNVDRQLWRVAKSRSEGAVPQITPSLEQNGAYTTVQAQGSEDDASPLLSVSLTHTLIFSTISCNASLSGISPTLEQSIHASINPFPTNGANSCQNGVAAPRASTRGALSSVPKPFP